MATYPDYVYQNLARARDIGQCIADKPMRQYCVSMCWHCSLITWKLEPVMNFGGW